MRKRKKEEKKMFEIEVKKEMCALHGGFESKILAIFGNRQMWSRCPGCSRLQEEREAEEKKVREEIEKQRAIELRLQMSGLSPRFKKKTFETFIPDSCERKSVLKFAKEYVDNFNDHYENGDGLIFSGGTGVGKGHLAAGIANELIKRGRGVYFLTAFDLILKMRASWSDKTAESEFSVLEMMSNISLLIIDEVGVKISSDSDKSQLFNLINRRYEAMKPTIILTNLNSKELKSAMGDRSFSRIFEVSRWVSFDGILDFRLN